MSQTLLSYGHASEPEIFMIAAKSRLYRSAVIFWFISLFVGIGIFGLWILTRSQAFELLGFLWLGGGTLMAIISFGQLIVFVASNWSKTSRPGKQVLLPAVLLTAMLGSNFVAAGGVLRAVDWVKMNWPSH